MKQYTCWIKRHSGFLPSGKSARSSLTCSLRTVHLWETRGRPPSWSLESKAAWPTSASSLTALALRPSAPPWPRFRTTWTRPSNKWTRCTWALVATPKDPQTVGANLPTKWTSTGNESSEENPYELENPSDSLNLATLSAPFGLFSNQYWLISIVILRAEFVCECVNVCVCVCTRTVIFLLRSWWFPRTIHSWLQISPHLRWTPVHWS